MADERSKFLDILERAGFDALLSVVRIFKYAQCESPIERLMLAALYSMFRFTLPYRVVVDPEGVLDPLFQSSTADIIISPQAQIGSYRVDFLIRVPMGKFGVIIECDGHDFHERTKEQARRDRYRDRDLQSKGYLVLRFTGSEIWENAYDCAAQVWKVIVAKIDTVLELEREKIKAEIDRNNAALTAEERAQFERDKADKIAQLQAIEDEHNNGEHNV